MRINYFLKLILAILVALNISDPIEASYFSLQKGSQTKRRFNFFKKTPNYNLNIYKDKKHLNLFEENIITSNKPSKVKWSKGSIDNYDNSLNWKSNFRTETKKRKNILNRSSQNFSRKNAYNTYINRQNQLEIESSIQSEKQNIIYAEGDVIARFNGHILKADKLTYDKVKQIAEAQGNIKIFINNQLFEAKRFNYDFLKQKGYLISVKGLFNTQNVIDDLNFDFKPNIYTDLQTIKKIKKEKVLYTPGEVKNWNFETKELIIDENKWQMKKAFLSNDLLDTKQIRLELNQLEVTTFNEKLKFKSALNYLIIEDKLSLPFLFGERTVTKRNENIQYKNKWNIGFDNLDKDGYFVGRKFKPINLASDFILNVEPQLLFQRSIKGQTKSYIKKGSSVISNRIKQDTSLLDYFAINSSIKGNINNWDLILEKELSSFDLGKFSNALRLRTELTKRINFLNSDFDNSFYGVYRDRVWNGSIGESEIYGGYGWKLDKENNWKVGEVKKNEYMGFGIGYFKAERLNAKNLNTSPKVEFFYEYEQSNPLVANNSEGKFIDNTYVYIPEPINNGIFLKTKFSSLISFYENSNHQEYLGFGLGPEIVFGNFKRKYLDYSRVSILPFYKLKNGESVFKFDQISENLTLDINYDQQIIGPIMFKTYGKLNLDNDSEQYGDFIDSRISINWKKRSYEFGFFFQPHDESGGINFSLFGFE